MSSNGATNASVTLAYTGINLDLSGDADLNFLFASVSSTSATVPVSVTLNGVTFDTSVGISASLQNFLVALTSANFPGVNFSSITSMTVAINDGNPGTGFILNNIGADPSPTVPEPGSLLLWGVVGMVGTWYGCRKMQRKLAV